MALWSSSEAFFYFYGGSRANGHCEAKVELPSMPGVGLEGGQLMRIESSCMVHAFLQLIGANVTLIRSASKHVWACSCISRLGPWGGHADNH